MVLIDTIRELKKELFPPRKIGTICILFFIACAFALNISQLGEQQFSYLSQEFLRGKLFFSQNPPLPFSEAVLFNGHYFSHLGPFPAVVLMPFSFIFRIFGIFFYQGYLQFFLTLCIFILCFSLARRWKYSSHDSLLLAGAFCFASVYQFIAMVPWSWYFAQAVAVFLVFWAIHEYFDRRRYWLIGILFACVFMTRITAGFGILFFFAAILFESGPSFSKKIHQCLMLGVPLIVSVLLLFGYNYARFQDPLDNGYTTMNSGITSEESRYELIHYGLFQLQNIPTNVYYYFFKTVDPITLLRGNQYILIPPYVTINFPGTSFFVVSPFFLYLFRARFRDRVVRYALLPIVVILCFLLLYFWPGWRQVGPRYLLDLLPFVYVMILTSFGGAALSPLARRVIIGSSFFDLYLYTLVMSQ